MSDERILVVGPAWVGDMVMAQTLFMLLHERWPKACVDVVAPAWSVPLVARMPEIRHAHVLPLSHGELGLGARRALGHALRGEAFDRAIVLPRSFKAALVPWHARIPVRTGYRGEMRYGLLNDRRRLDKLRLPTTVSRYAALGLDNGIDLPTTLPQPQLTSDAGRARELAAELGLNLDGPIVALLPGAEYGPAKQWPVSHFADLARRLTQQGSAVWVFGSRKEFSLGEEICAAGHGSNLCGRTQLVDVVDLLAMADVAVSNDSGLMHIAAATGCGVVGIYGSSSPTFTPPLTSRACIMIAPQPCSPCFERTCRFDHYRCLTDVTVGSVHEAAESFLRPAATA